MASAEHLSADVNFTGNLAAPPPIPKADLAPAHGGDSLLHGDRVVGTVTSAAWGHRVGKNLAMAFVDPEFSAEGATLSIDIVGQRFPATVTAGCLYDPANAKARG